MASREIFEAAKERLEERKKGWREDDGNGDGLGMNTNRDDNEHT